VSNIVVNFLRQLISIRSASSFLRCPFCRFWQGWRSRYFSLHAQTTATSRDIHDPRKWASPTREPPWKVTQSSELGKLPGRLSHRKDEARIGSEATWDNSRVKSLAAVQSGFQYKNCLINQSVLRQHRSVQGHWTSENRRESYFAWSQICTLTSDFLALVILLQLNRSGFLLEAVLRSALYETGLVWAQLDGI